MFSRLFRGHKMQLLTLLALFFFQAKITDFSRFSYTFKLAKFLPFHILYQKPEKSEKCTPGGGVPLIIHYSEYPPREVSTDFAE